MTPVGPKSPRAAGRGVVARKAQNRLAFKGHKAGRRTAGEGELCLAGPSGFEVPPDPLDHEMAFWREGPADGRAGRRHARQVEGGSS